MKETLSHLKKADLIIGIEATQNTTSKYIMIEDSKILKPYNEMILKNLQISEWGIYSNSLAWNTTADWFNIRGEKEDRKGNIGADLSLGWDNEAYGITANIGYDTKGKNRRAGLGLRVIF